MYKCISYKASTFAFKKVIRYTAEALAEAHPDYPSLNKITAKKDPFS